MTIPFIDNPKIFANWFNEKTEKFKKGIKRAYYDISIDDNKLKLKFREEKKRLGGSGELERHWCSYLEFDLDSTVAKDLKMFLNAHVKGDAPEVENDN